MNIVEGSGMRILFVATVGETHRAFLRGQVKFLQQKGYEVHLAAAPGPALDDCRKWVDVQAWSVPMSRKIQPFQDIAAVFRLIYLFRKLRPDIINLSTPKAALLGSIASVFFKNTKTVFLVRGSISGSRRGWSENLNKWAEYLTAKLSDEVVVVSESLLHFLRMHKVISKHEGCVLGNGMSNGINIRKFQPMKKPVFCDREQGPVIGFVGRLTNEKGIETLFSAWKSLSITYPEAQLLLVGPWDNEVPISDEIKLEIMSDKRVTVTGFVEDTVSFYEQMDVFVFPSLREGFPNAPMEASAMQIPVIGSRAIGTVDAIMDGITGSLVDQNSPQQIVDAISQYVLDPESAQKHGKAGRARVEEKFTQEKVWLAFSNFYQKLNNKKIKSTSFYSSYGKRCLDLMLAVLAAVLLLPVLAITIFVIWLRLGRPVFYTQPRGGRGGRSFNIYKFRTMTDACDTTGKLLPDDERLTPFGNWLREKSIDELPELWNIIRGDMSIVGPRPLTSVYLDRYSQEQRKRHEVRPGLTGLAQIKGRNNLSWEEKFSYDLQYVEGYSFFWDLKIIFQTAAKIFRGDDVKDGLHKSPTEFLGVHDTQHVPEVKSYTSQQVWPYFDEEQRSAVEQVLKTGKVNYWSGEQGRHFESEYAEFVGRKHAVAVANGTVAIELALESLGVGKGDDVLVPSRTFVATASAVITRGAKPIFVDIDQLTQNVTANHIKAAFTKNTKAIIVVHVGGMPCDMDPILSFSREKNIPIIEDCAQAHGATYKGQQVGSFGAIGTYSFCQDKIISTGGEGGMVVMDDHDIWKKAWSYKDHGKNFDLVQKINSTGSFRYLHESVGTNLRLTEMQSAIGRIQLKRLNEWVIQRRRNGEYLRSKLAGCPGLIFPETNEECSSSFYRLYALIDLSLLACEWTRDRIIKEVNAAGFPLGCGSCGEIYLEKSLEEYRPKEPLPNAHMAQESSLAFLVHPGLTENNLDGIARALTSVMFQAVNKTGKTQQRAA